MGKKLLDGLVGISRTKVDSLESAFRSHLSAKAVIWSEPANWFGVCEPMQGEAVGATVREATAIQLLL